MSSQLKKLMICPYFGDFPPWMDKYLDQLPRLKEEGYDFLIDTDLEGFKKRVKQKLGIDAPIVPGQGKVWDYRGLLGYLYEEELLSYDFWGHTDFDVVYGDVGFWVSDKFLNDLDIHSNHATYMNGCWSLYRNIPEVNMLFKKIDYEKYLLGEPNGWVEGPFSRLVESSGLRWKYTFFQGNPWAEKFNLKFENGRLYQDNIEIMMFHFRKKKVWPL